MTRIERAYVAAEILAAVNRERPRGPSGAVAVIDPDRGWYGMPNEDVAAHFAEQRAHLDGEAISLIVRHDDATPDGVIARLPVEDAVRVLLGAPEHNPEVQRAKRLERDAQAQREAERVRLAAEDRAREQATAAAQRAERSAWWAKVPREGRALLRLADRISTANPRLSPAELTRQIAAALVGEPPKVRDGEDPPATANEDALRVSDFGLAALAERKQREEEDHQRAQRAELARLESRAS